MNNLDTYLRRKGAYLVDLVAPDFIPGRLVKIHYFWKLGDFGPESVLQDDRGPASALPGIPALTVTPRRPSSLYVENVTDQWQIAAGVGLPQYGITANTDLQSGVTATLTISNVETQTFDDNTLSELYSTVLPTLRKLGQSDPNKWLQDCFLVKEAFFVTALSATLHTTGNISAQAAFSQAGIKASGNFALTWNNDHELTLVGNADVPFAVRGDGLG
jgi:hypothetical protein